MRLSFIVAMSRGGVIGRAEKLPWRLSSDLKRFKALTMGHHLIMGRKTFASLGRALPGRTSVVVTRQAAYHAPGVLRAPSVEEAIHTVSGDDEAFIIGGGEIFQQALPLASRMYATWVEANVEGDTFFPEIDWSQWREISSERHFADAKNEYDTTFCVYDRITEESR
jgi:dihydrofolate reductase